MATALVISHEAFLVARAERAMQDATPPRPVGTPVRANWGQGCGESDGLIVGHAEPQRYRQRDGSDHVVHQYRILSEEGNEGVSELRDDKGGPSPIGWHVAGTPAEGWEAQAQAWRDAAAKRKADAEAAQAAKDAATLATIAAWKAEAGADVTVVDSYCGKVFSAIGPGGSWRLWRETRPACREVKPGDQVCTGSYNLVYMSPMVRVTKGMVFFNDYGKEKRMTIAKLASKNVDLDVERAAKRNREWMD